MEKQPLSERMFRTWMRVELVYAAVIVALVLLFSLIF